MSIKLRYLSYKCRVKKKYESKMHFKIKIMFCASVINHRRMRAKMQMSPTTFRCNERLHFKMLHSISHILVWHYSLGKVKLVNVYKFMSQ